MTSPGRRRPEAGQTPPAAGPVDVFLAELRAQAFDIGLCSGVLIAAALTPLLFPGGTS